MWMKRGGRQDVRCVLMCGRARRVGRAGSVMFETIRIMTLVIDACLGENLGDVDDTVDLIAPLADGGN